MTLVRGGRRSFGASFDRTRLDNLTLGLDRFASRNLHRLPLAIARLSRVRRITARLYGAYDALLTPTLADVTPRIGHLDPTADYQQIIDRLVEWVAFTPLQNATGEPAISLPLAESDAGMPVGMMFAAGVGHEARLLELAYELEEARPWPRIQSRHDARLLYDQASPGAGAVVRCHWYVATRPAAFRLEASGQPARDTGAYRHDSRTIRFGPGWASTRPRREHSRRGPAEIDSLSALEAVCLPPNQTEATASPVGFRSAEASRLTQSGSAADLEMHRAAAARWSERMRAAARAWIGDSRLGLRASTQRVHCDRGAHRLHAARRRRAALGPTSCGRSRCGRTRPPSVARAAPG